MNRIKRILSLLSIFFLSGNELFAQEVEMASGLRSEGKIYVVVLVLSIIILGLFGYLFYLDKKISKKEKVESDK